MNGLADTFYLITLRIPDAVLFTQTPGTIVVNLSRPEHVQRFVRTLVVVFMPPTVEALLLRPHIR
jgi:hypothetical protein